MGPGRLGAGRVRHRAWLVAALAGLILGPGAPARADVRDHDIKLPARDRAVTGEHRTLSLTLAPQSGHSISRQGPLVIALHTASESDDALHLPRRRYHRRAAADAQAEAPRFDLRYQAVAPGQHTLRVDLRFWVCARRTCRPVHASREVTIEVAAPAPDPATPG